MLVNVGNVSDKKARCHQLVATVTEMRIDRTNCHVHAAVIRRRARRDAADVRNAPVGLDFEDTG